MDMMAGWGLFTLCIVTNIVVFLLIDGWFEGDVPGLSDDEEL